jgi:DNA repair exonuclease SbcCD nuclease subunit
MDRAVRVLFLSDTHLGFDHPARPRVERRRRGPEFFAACRRALEPARRGEVDAVVHGGDLLFRSRVPAWLVAEAVAPLREVADAGVPVVIVAGNHERSRIPYPLLAAHPDIHLVDAPRTVRLRVRGVDLAVAGFPFARHVDRVAFATTLEATGWRRAAADVRLLAIHQAIEGATVGPHGFVFRPGPEVVAGADLPRGLAAVLCGHVHRAQVLRRDLAGRPLPAPVVLAGSTCRTSFAERDETKGYVVLDLAPDERHGGGRLVAARFRPLPARPMIVLEPAVGGLAARDLAATLARLLCGLDPDAIVCLRPRGRPRASALGVLEAAALRRLAPPTMTVSLDRRTAAELLGPGPAEPRRR